jgi:putative RNA 2'-phosphotransferase
VNDKRRVSVSKFISKYLRHAPHEIGLTLGDGGWVPVPDLLTAAARHRFPITREELEEVVRTCEKQRFALDHASDLIRANQGHSVDVELKLEPLTPPAELFHGTATRFRDAILAAGLIKMSRQHVHLSADLPTAVAVGKRHGRPTVFALDTMSMHRDGHLFYRAANGVWLTDHVPPQYLRELPGDQLA